MKRDKEWFIKELLGHEIGDYGNYYNSGYEDGLAYVLKLAHQLNEPEKVTIPQFVADWWERDGDSVTLYGGLRVKKKHKFDLVSNFHDKGLGDYLSKVEDWLDENNSIFLDLVNGKPYEVEKEPLYFISFPKPDLGCINMWRNTDTGSYYFAKSSSVTSQDGYKCVFTEKEIKEHDERFWPFAVEVES